MFFYIRFSWLQSVLKREQILQDTVRIVLIVVVETRGERMEGVPDKSVDQRLELRLRLAEVEATSERRHRTAAL